MFLLTNNLKTYIITDRIYVRRFYLLKMHLIFLTILIGISSQLYAQTWTVRYDDDPNTDVKNTIISKNEFDRIKRASEALCSYAFLTYFECIPDGGRVISGSRPVFNGYYYIKRELIPRTQIGRNDVDLTYSIIMYGNSNTGFMIIKYFQGDYGLFENGSVAVGSSNFIRRYNTLIQLVNNE